MSNTKSDLLSKLTAAQQALNDALTLADNMFLSPKKDANNLRSRIQKAYQATEACSLAWDLNEGDDAQS